MENKRVLRELVTRWNRPVYEKGTSYRAMRSHDEPEAMEVTPSGSSSGVRRRRMISGNMSKRDGASRNEAVGNILSARARCISRTLLKWCLVCSGTPHKGHHAAGLGEANGPVLSSH